MAQPVLWPKVRRPKTVCVGLSNGFMASLFPGANLPPREVNDATAFALTLLLRYRPWQGCGGICRLAVTDIVF